MKKTLVLIALCAVASAGVALADDDIGCGLGTQLWAGNSGLVPKVLGATTNGTLGNQTFGITSGTLGCSSAGVITAQARLQMFAGANLDRLARDMASGEGETLDAMARLMGIAEADKSAFAHLTKTNFAEIFSADRVTAGDVLAAINHLMAADPQLSKYVTT